MATRIIDIILDLQKKYILSTGYEFVQDDINTNVLNIQILNNGNVVDLTDKTTTITLKRADGMLVIGCPKITDALNGKIQYTLGTQEIDYPGRVVGSIEIFDAYSRITTPQFCFSVRQELNTGEGLPIVIDSGSGNPAGYFGCTDIEMSLGSVELIQQYKPADWVGSFKAVKFKFYSLDNDVTIRINNKYTFILFSQEEFITDRMSLPIETFEIVSTRGNTGTRYTYRGEY